jgi:hypothetical protein
MKYIFHPIGSIFEDKLKGINVILKVVESHISCSGCYYRLISYDSCYKHKHACTKHLRRDDKFVIFKKIN